MFTKQNLISTIVAAIWSFIGGYLLWGVLAESFMSNHMGTATGVFKEVPEFGVLALGCLIQAFAFSGIFRKWGAANYSAMDGLKYGFWIGIFAGFGNALIDYAVSNMLDLTGALVNGLIYVLFFTIMGLLVGFMYGKVK
jgi:hypothetical protein